MFPQRPAGSSTGTNGNRGLVIARAVHKDSAHVRGCDSMLPSNHSSSKCPRTTKGPPCPSDASQAACTSCSTAHQHPLSLSRKWHPLESLGLLQNRGGVGV
eukprot:6475257-Amphidinium_carterae.2